MLCMYVKCIAANDLDIFFKETYLIFSTFLDYVSYTWWCESITRQ